MGIKLETEKTNLKIQNIQEDPDELELKRKFLKYKFQENKTVKGMNGSRHTLKTGRKIYTTKKPSNTDTPATSGWKRDRKAEEKQPHTKCNEHQRKLFRQLSSKYREKRKKTVETL